MIICGIDPGMSGACAALTEGGKYVTCFDMPTVLANKSSNRQMVSSYELANLLRAIMTEARGDVVAVLEHVQAMPGQPTAPGLLM